MLFARERALAGRYYGAISELVCSKCGSRQIDMVVTGAKQGERPRRRGRSRLLGVLPYSAARY